MRTFIDNFTLNLKWILKGACQERPYSHNTSHIYVEFIAANYSQIRYAYLFEESNLMKTPYLVS